MLINGKKITGANYEVVVLPRPDGKRIVFKAAALLDMAKFESLCPPPKPPNIQKRGGEWTPDYEDAAFLEKQTAHFALGDDYMVIESLSATEGLTWEQVIPSEPATWGLWRDELKAAGISSMELTYIIRAVRSANALDENKLKVARESFFAEGQSKQPST